MRHALALVACTWAACAAAGELTVIRPTAFVGQEWPYYVLVGDKAVADLNSGERVTLQVPSDLRSLAIHCPKGMGSAYAESRIDRDFSAPTYLVLSARRDCVSIEAVDAKAASRLMNSTRSRPADRAVQYEKPSVVYPSAALGEAAQVPTTPTNEAASRESIASATGAWAEAFNARDAARVAAMYEADAVLTDTSEAKPRIGAQAIADYYRSVAQRPTQRVALGERTIRVFGDTAIDAGNLTYFEMRDGKATTTPGRYSITYRNRGGRWLIVDHHSSVLPR